MTHDTAANQMVNLMFSYTWLGTVQVKWSVVASRLPGRIGKQCRERWFNHLDPSIKKGEWSPEEDRIVFGAQVRICRAVVSGCSIKISR